MAVKRCKASLDVLQAAKIRVQNVFNNGLTVFLSFSGGKDSLCLAQIVLRLIQEGKINPSQLVVQFIDEEAIFPCIEAKVKEWRNKFLLVGAKFEWYCLEVKHYNCFNELSNDESFICWDRYKKNVWVRQMPSFAIKSHPLFKPRKDTYQDFLARICKTGISIVGVRASESIQRLQYISLALKTGKTMTNKHYVYPLYDWKDNDVWLYLFNEKVDIPNIYLYLWQVGTKKRQLRVSQFFSIDTAKSLVNMNEYYPNLMDRIIEREPNAYLAALYWDSEMFGRRTKTRKEIEANEPQKNYRDMLIALFSDMSKNFTTKNKFAIAEKYKRLFIKVSAIATDEDYKSLYEGLIRGDPKARTLRALYLRIFTRYFNEAKIKEGIKNGD